MKRRGRRRVVLVATQFEPLLALDEMILKQDAIWLASGYHRSRARLDRRKDGTYTLRMVWRNPDEIVKTITATVSGIRLA